MNMIEKQAELGRTLFEINTSTMREYAEMQRSNLEKYLELNRSFAKKLPEIRDIATFMELQRVYNENLWSGVRESVQEQTELFKGAVEGSGEAVRTVFSQEEEAAPAK